MTLSIRDLPRAEWEALRIECFDRDDWRCVKCGSEDELQADHVKSIKRYPELALDLDNLQTLCGPCNRRKSDSDDTDAERLPWVHPDYPELAALVFSDASTTATSVAPPPHTETQENP